MRENDNHPLTWGTYDDGAGNDRTINLEVIAELRQSLLALVDGCPIPGWVTWDQAVLQTIRSIKSEAGIL